MIFTVSFLLVDHRFIFPAVKIQTLYIISVLFDLDDSRIFDRARLTLLRPMTLDASSSVIMPRSYRAADAIVAAGGRQLLQETSTLLSSTCLCVLFAVNEMC